MMNSFFEQDHISPNQELNLPLLKEKHIRLWVKREDLIHPFVSGNKFRKLKLNLREMKRTGQHKILTFGGAYSNHILATAVAAFKLGFESVGVIRGEELGKHVDQTFRANPTLRGAKEHGMQFLFVSRAQYKQKSTPDFLADLQDQFGDCYILPEGGTNEFAIEGCQEILTEQDAEFDYICSCVGTGGTLAGLIKASRKHQMILGFPALKGDFLTQEIQTWIDNRVNWKLISAYHFGGYAKFNEELIQFMNTFKQTTEIPLDPIYTGKMLFGIFDLIEKDFFAPGSKILVIHTGGLQGIEGFNNKLENLKYSIRIA